MYLKVLQQPKLILGFNHIPFSQGEFDISKTWMIFPRTNQAAKGCFYLLLIDAFGYLCCWDVTLFLWLINKTIQKPDFCFAAVECVVDWWGWVRNRVKSEKHWLDWSVGVAVSTYKYCKQTHPTLFIHSKPQRVIPRKLTWQIHTQLWSTLPGNICWELCFWNKRDHLTHKTGLHVATSVSPILSAGPLCLLLCNVISKCFL